MSHLGSNGYFSHYCFFYERCLILEKELLYPINNNYRQERSLDGLWHFKFDYQSIGESEGWQNKLTDSVEMPVPASFNDFFTDKGSREYVGDFWYERNFFVPSDWKEKFVGIRFDAATHRAEVFVNGQKIRTHEGGFLPFLADISSAVQFGKENIVAIKINNELHRDKLPAGDTITLENGKKMVKPFFDFFNYSGLNRSVHLISLSKDRIIDYSAVTTNISENSATVQYEVTSNSNDQVKVELFDENGLQIAQSNGVKGTLQVSNPHLWEIHEGYLYTIKIILSNETGIIDEYSDEIGIRTVKVNHQEILLNGKSVYLRGFGRHEDSNFAGRGFDLKVEKRDLELMKWIGANSYRTSHYPYDEQAYKMADRAGILIINEVPAVGFKMAAAGFLGGLDQNFFDGEWLDDLYVNHIDQIKDLIKRDKNHPSVFAWSFFNEPDTATEKCVPYFEKIFADTKNLDPDGRPRTFTLNEDDTFETSHALKFPDIYLLNRYPGWYHKWGYEISDGEAYLRREMDQWQTSNMDKPIVFSEYGADTQAGLHKLPSVMWTEEYQVELLKMFNRVFDSYPFIKGEQVWNLADFQTVEGNQRVDGNKKGIFTRERQPKASAFYLKERWRQLPLNFKSKDDQETN